MQEGVFHGSGDGGGKRAHCNGDATDGGEGFGIGGRRGALLGARSGDWLLPSGEQDEGRDRPCRPARDAAEPKQRQ